MATVTLPDLIEAHDDSDAFDPPAAYAALAASVQRAFAKRENYDFYWPDAAARTAEADGIAMSLGFQVDNKTVWMHNGTSWKLWSTLAPIAFTPTWTNLTVGNAVQLWTYSVAAGLVTVRGFLAFGTTTSIGAGPWTYMTVPLPANGLITSAPNSGSDQSLGTAFLEDLATALCPGVVVTYSTGGVIYARFAAFNAAGTYTLATGILTAIPFTWGNGDFLNATYTFQPD